MRTFPKLLDAMKESYKQKAHFLFGSAATISYDLTVLTQKHVIMYGDMILKERFE